MQYRKKVSKSATFYMSYMSCIGNLKPYEFAQSCETTSRLRVSSNVSDSISPAKITARIFNIHNPEVMHMKISSCVQVHRP